MIVKVLSHSERLILASRRAKKRVSALKQMRLRSDVAVGQHLDNHSNVGEKITFDAPFELVELRLHENAMSPMQKKKSFAKYRVYCTTLTNILLGSPPCNRQNKACLQAPLPRPPTPHGQRRRSVVKVQ